LSGDQVLLVKIMDCNPRYALRRFYFERNKEKPGSKVIKLNINLIINLFNIMISVIFKKKFCLKIHFLEKNYF
jgi:hypothetical protein